MRYLAHSPTETHPDGQPLLTHLQNVSALAAEAAAKFNAEATGAYCGLLHDIGKYSDAFQRHLAGDRTPVDHSTAGACVANDRLAFAAAVAIMGHHAGLPDLGSPHCPAPATYFGRLSDEGRARLEDCSAYAQEVQLPPAPSALPNDFVDAYFYIKLLFSALVDADWTDTGAYFSGDQPPHYDTLDILAERLRRYFDSLGAPQNELNRLRTDIREALLSHTEDAPGLFTLTVPTGGGKTLASVAFALRHALANHLDRIIYVIPYCSILEQTGAVFRSIFGQENVLLHYSGAEFDTDSDDPNAYLSENWDAPIILTTAVQFFESVYANKPSRVRKIHRATRSVIIFDEAQMLPTPLVEPCVCAIAKFITEGHASAVLCTATQPSLQRIFEKYLPGGSPTELCPQALREAEVFRRVCYQMEGPLSDADLAARVAAEPQALCILNNRAEAQRLYSLVPGDGVYCLTTWLTPNDRHRILCEIRERLASGKRCTVFATSLVEAGVDLDFPVVWRALAGLDSVIQAGGRCNREGKRPRRASVVHVFIPEASSPSSLQKNIGATMHVFTHENDLSSEAAIAAYYKFLFYTLKAPGELDEKDIIKNVRKLNFRTVSDRFHMIDDGGAVTVYIPGAATEAVDAVARGELTRSILRRAARDAVSVPRRLAAEAEKFGRIRRITENGYLLTDPAAYDPKIGFQMNCQTTDYYW